MMRILDKLEDDALLSHSEIIVASYLLNYNLDLNRLNVKDIAKATSTSPSTTIRLAKKLNFNGWNDLKLAIQKEKDLLSQQFHDVDMNFPFDKNDSIQTINQKISLLMSNTIIDTASLVQHDDLSRAISYLSKSHRIYIFAMSNSATITYDFQYKMRFLYKDVIIINNRDDFSYYLHLVTKDDCCIFISYSGETFKKLGLVPYLKTSMFHSISITQYSNNSLVDYTDAHFYISSKEELYNKVAPYASNESIHYILDLLYSCTFNASFDENLNKRKKYVESTDYPNTFKK